MLILLLGCHPDAKPHHPGGPGGTDPAGPTTAEDPGTTDLGTTDPVDPGDRWVPAPGVSWQWQLTGQIDASVDADVYDIDLFEAPQGTIDALHDAGRKVVCYFSAGSYEDWRPDADQFPPEDIGNPLDDWPGEWWVDPRSDAVRAIMKARLDLAVDKDCDAVEPDNVEAWAAPSGFDVTRADQLEFNRFLATEGHARGLSVGLKNVVELVDDLVDDFDWSLDEECLAYDECRGLRPFLDKGAAVLHVEYVDRESQGADKADEVCGDPTIEGFSTLIKTWDLDDWRIACP
jgi:hypothetical protein